MKIFYNLFMSELSAFHDNLPRHIYDVLAILNTPEATEALNELRFRLATFSDESTMSQPRIDEEAELIDSFNQRFFGAYFLDRPITVTFAQEEEDSSNFEIGTISARFVGVTSEIYHTNQALDRNAAIYDTFETKQPALCISADNEYYTLPLDGNLLQCGIDAPPLPGDSNTVLGKLQNVEAVLSHLITTPTFQAMDEETQEKQILEIMRECQDNSQIAATSNVPSVILTENGVTTVNSFQLIPVISGESSRLYLSLNVADLENPMAIRPSAIEAIIPDHQRNDTLQVVDTLRTFFMDKVIQGKMRELENAVNYASEDERPALIEHAANEMNTVVDEELDESESFWNSTYDVDGMLYWQRDNAIVVDDGQIYDATIATFDMLYIDGRWRIVIAYEALNDERDEEEIVYVVPDEHYTSKIEGRFDPQLVEEYVNDFDMIQYFHDTAAGCAGLTSSRAFYRLRHEAQVHKLREVADGIEATLADRLGITEGSIITCAAGNYYPIPSKKVNATCKEIATYDPVRSVDLPENQRGPISGRFTGVATPEAEATLNPAGKKFQSLNDFPLSGGEPMIVIDNKETGIAYFVPLREVVFINNAAIPEV